MESYSGFAQVYDTFMDNVPYEQWAKKLIEILQNNGIQDGLVLDLGCGTGSLTELLAKAGYDMIGIDCSGEMLEIANEKKLSHGENILYLQQDMREFELYGTVKAIVCTCDSVNYILEREDLIKVFSLVNNYLDPDGIFIFDFNTDYKYKEVIGNRVIAEDREEVSFIWDNFYDEEERINEYQLSIFAKVDDDRNLYEKFEEYHYQKGYYLKEMIDMIKESGLQFIKAWDFEENQEATEQTERVVIIAKECGK